MSTGRLSLAAIGVRIELCWRKKILLWRISGVRITWNAPWPSLWSYVVLHGSDGMQSRPSNHFLRIKKNAPSL